MTEEQRREEFRKVAWRHAKRCELVPNFQLKFDKAFVREYAKTMKPVDTEELAKQVLEELGAEDPCKETN